MRHILARRSRARIAGLGHFGEPAWDILLDLFVASAMGRRVTVWNACLAGQVAGSTGLRYLRCLEKDGVVVRTPDPTDRRRFHVRLSDKAYVRMADWALLPSPGIRK